MLRGSLFTKLFILLIIQVFTYATAYCQTDLIPTITRTSEPTYVNPYPELVQIKIPTPYDEAIFDTALQKVNLNEIEILAWDLLFTQYPKGVNHDKLNERRLQWLQKRLPVAFSIPKQHMRIIEQTKAKTIQDAQKEFHGFALYYRNKASEKVVKEDVDYLENVVKVIKEIPITKPPKPNMDWMPKQHIKEQLRGRTKHSLPCPNVEYYYTCNTSEMKKKFRQYFEKVEVLTLNELMLRSMLFNRNAYVNCDSIIVGYNCMDKDGLIIYKDTGNAVLDLLTKIKSGKTTTNILRDSTILNTFNRTNWNNAIICTDVTASMSPYTAQLLIWLRAKNTSATKNTFYFFNDGDNKKDKDKKIGSTGGIYQVSSTDFSAIASTMTTAMRKGDGGDFPENNLECVLKAQADNPTAKEIILIADNWTTVKDIALLPKIKVPVRVILCGNVFAIEPHYLAIAYKTGGSVHTLNDDIIDISKMREGDILQYKKRRYQLQKGVFILLT